MTSRLIYEREIRATLSKLERVLSFIPEEAKRQKTQEDLQRLSDQFRDLVFAEDASTELENGVIEKNLKKLLTVSKSKFYMLRVNFPKAFEVSVDTDIDPSSAYDPLADRNSETSMKVAQGVGMDQQTILNEDESEENRKKRDAII